jgi:hypothetical protein
MTVSYILHRYIYIYIALLEPVEEPRGGIGGALRIRTRAHPTIIHFHLAFP